MTLCTYCFKFNIRLPKCRKKVAESSQNCTFIQSALNEDQQILITSYVRGLDSIFDVVNFLVDWSKNSLSAAEMSGICY
jgi:hypothetical protein